eukprot:CAMPEP_0117033454 /NCGR_PEP_ID=MMETSP0472-20121206/23902_1 /TAXON_ID=693140 ORGANISM="Tiarina fusus, Strain LIS" /NCGR_SAMPLE_ID=MMETSP0472 /ASSEMBLY_ACC=CAM_ASM_000603 /LENGTH=1984 /DNA_ID=CAMNT_0004742375 /DNA_START=28 /DNA_END=5983 /DNA_ORIENTATION=+
MVITTRGQSKKSAAEDDEILDAGDAGNDNEDMEIDSVNNEQIDQEQKPSVLGKRKNYKDPNEEEEGEEEGAPGQKREKLGLRTRKRQNYSEEEAFQESIANAVEKEWIEPAKIPPVVQEKKVEWIPRVEKILAHRYDEKGEIEYYVKWKNRSYLHVAWVGPDEFSHERYSKRKLLRYHKKEELLYDEADEIFNASFLEVDRIIAHYQGEEEMEYFVKWDQMSYTESTWEFMSDLKDDNKIAEYHKRQKTPSPKSWKVKPRPPASEWSEYEESPKYKGDNKLRPYQLEGLNWLSFCWYNKRNSILADEMGLEGKTVQTVSVLNHLYTKVNMHGPFLIVAPLITVPHWQREFEGWTDMNAIVYHGTAASRELIRKYEWSYDSLKGSPPPHKFNVLITTYEMVLTDMAILSKIHWRYLAVDEAHRLKNTKCKLINALRLFQFDHLLLLTGTPLQNNTEELWTLLNFMDPEKFESVSDFSERFGDLKKTKQVEELHEVLRPYLLRRMKEDVEKSIAPKEETIVEVELTTIQKSYYRAIFERNFSSLNMGAKASNVPSLLNIMMQLRKCCNHPYLLRGVEDNIVKQQNQQDENELMINSCGKLVLVDKLLAKLKDSGHKVLIFSQMVRMLDILEDHMIYRKYPYERIDGSKRGNERQEAIDRFSAPDSDRFVFLLCTRAGGLGINLTAADTCIIYDSDWNPQNDIQAQARCHRIGQTQMVKIYRLLTHNTYEKKMFEKASLKLGLDQAVLTKMKSGGSSSNNVPLNTKEVNELLKYGAYGAFDETPGTDQYDEEDIDKILERVSTTVVVGGKSEAPVNNALSSFSKASFISADAESNAHVDVTDPDFWKKLMPDAPVIDPLVQFVPRRRKQVRRYGNVDAIELAALEARSDSDSEMEEYEETHDEPSDDGALGWNTRDRNRLKTQLQTFGYGQWYTVRKAAGLERRSVDEVRAYGDALISRFITFLGEDPDEGLAHLRANYIPERYGPCAQPVERPILPTEENSEENKNEADPTGSATPGQDTEITHTEENATSHSDANSASHTEENATSQIDTNAASQNDVPMEDAPNETIQAEAPKTETAESDGDAMVVSGDVTPVVCNPSETADPTVTSEIKDANMEEAGVQETENKASPNETVESKNENTTSDDKEKQSDPKKDGNEGSEADNEATGDDNEMSGDDNEVSETKSGEENENGTQESENSSPTFNFDGEGTLRGHEFKEYAKRNAKLLIRRLESIAKASKHTIDCIAMFGEDIKIPAIPGEVCDSWVDADDRSLLLGTYCHGYNRFAEMRLDPLLTFERFHDPTDVPVNLQNDPRLVPSAVTPTEAPTDTPAEENQTETSAPTSPKSDQPQQEDTAPSEAPGASIESEAPPVEVEASSVENPSTTEQKTAESSPTKSQPGVTSVPEENNENDKGDESVEKTPLEQWPSEKVLNRRLRKVLRLIFIESNHKNAVEDGRTRKRGDVQQDWSKREKLDFYRVITTHGIRTTSLGQPDWNIFQEQAKLTRKTIPMISEYCASLITQSNNAMSLGKEYDVQRKQFLTALADGSDTKNDFSSLNWLAHGDISLSFAQCKRVLQRVKLFKDLREKIIPMGEKLSPYLSLARNSTTLPTWWIPSEHDKALIFGVVSHGFGAWEKICSDESLPFYSIAVSLMKSDPSKDAVPGTPNTPGHESDHDSAKEDDENDEKIETKPKKRKRGRQVEVYTNALDFPKEKMLTKRLEYLVRFLIEDVHKKKQPLDTIKMSPRAEKNAVQRLIRPQRTPRAKVKKESPPRIPERKKFTDCARDASGSPIFPITVGKMRVEALGVIVHDRPEYHNTKYIWPVGFRSARTYQSFLNPSERTEYTNEILDGGEKPLFRVTAADAPDHSATASSPTGAWSSVLRQVKNGPPLDKKSINAVSGPEYFGLARAVIRKLIQDLPGAEKCEKYRMVEFEEVEHNKRPRKKRKINNGAEAEAQPAPKPEENQTKITASFGVTSASGSRVSLLN